jgi:hypothetical protein
MPKDLRRWLIQSQMWTLYVGENYLIDHAKSLCRSIYWQWISRSPHHSILSSIAGTAVIFIPSLNIGRQGRSWLPVNALISV